MVGGVGDYQDDPTIPDTEHLWRRIPPDWIIFDEQRGRRRPSSQAFKNSPDGSPMSVFLGSATRDPQVALRGHDGYGLASITAGLARECAQRVARDPLPEAPTHAVVAGVKTNRVRERFAIESAWVIPPPPPR